MDLIEKYKFDGEGYNPVLISREWQVAFLNYHINESLESIVKLDIHHKTDEVFILLEGHCTLIAAEIKQGKITFDLKDMQPGIFYNIPCNTWHKIAMKEGCKVCIVEKSDTHISDFEFYDLSEEEINDLRTQVNNL